MQIREFVALLLEDGGPYDKVISPMRRMNKRRINIIPKNCTIPL